MSVEFRLPDLGEGLAEAEIVQWLVAEGDHVDLNQPIAEVETAKAVVELPSPHAGTVVALHAAAGDVVHVGGALVSFDAEAPARLAPAPHAVGAGAGATVPTLVGYGAAAASAGRPHRRPRALPAMPGAATVPLPVEPRRTPAEPPSDRASFTPGPGAVASPGPVAGSAARETRTPIRGVRRSTAEAMVRSAFTAPQATVFLTVDVTATMELIASLRADRVREGHSIGLLAVVARTTCLALRAHPMLNARWDHDAGEIVEHHYVNLGIAAATERGLIVPHLADADRMGLTQLADALREVTATARAGRATPSALSGGTFTFSNVGVFGVDAGTPILTPGEAGILALGAVRKRPWEHEGAIALRDVVTLSLTFDHRLVDGEQGARFLADVGAVLTEPGRALLLA